MNRDKKIEKEILDQYDFRTYRDYLKLNQVNTKAYLMLAELIDNSISSMDNNLLNGKWKHDLNIDIKIRFNSQTNLKSSIHSVNVYSKDSLIVTDNAFGMKKDILRGAMKLNKINNSSNSIMNSHGRGLKQSGFYFGTDLIVSTNDGESSYKIGLELSKQESLDSKIIFNVENSNKRSMGTRVFIKNINAKNRLTTNAWTDIKMALWERYKKYFLNNSTSIIKINFDAKFMNGSDIGTINGEGESITAVLSVIDRDKIDEIINLARISLNKKIKNNKDTIHEDTAEKAFTSISSVLNEAKIDSNKLFKFDLNLLFNEMDTNVKFWMLNRNKAKFRGIRVYENLRAILHGPITKGELTTYTDWYSITTRSGSTINRFAGEFDIKECNLKTTTDKSNFDAPRVVRENINFKIMSVWEVFDSFIMQGREEEKREIGEGLTHSEQSNIEGIFNSKYNYERVKFSKYDMKTNDVIVVVKFDDSEIWEFTLKIDKTPGKKNIFDKVADQYSQTLLIVANTAHMFWKTIDKMSKTKFASELVQPLSILIGMQYIEMFKKNGSNIDSMEILNKGESIFNGNS